MVLVNTIANAAVVYSENQTDVSVFDDYVTINSGVTIQDITINETVVELYNHGTVNGTIDTNGNILHVYNDGTISGNIISSIDGGKVIQKITPEFVITDMHTVGINHVVEINYNNQNLAFNDIKNLPATSFSLSNANIIIDNFNDWQNWGQSVSLDGPVVLVINDKDSVSSGAIINNIISGADNLQVDIQGLDSLYSIELTPSGQTKILNLVHEPDNDIVLNCANNGDGPLEKIRQNNPNDKLVVALDNANNRSEVNKIKRNSYRFNHDILLRPIKAINNFSMFDKLDNTNELGVGINVDYVMSDTTNDFGGHIYFGNNFENLYLNVSFDFNSFTYEDKLNDFSGKSYGLNIHAKQSSGLVWIDGMLGVTLVQYDADYITSKNNLSKDPFGVFEYAKIDAGHNFEVFPDLILSPFVGIGMQQYNVADVSDFDLNIRSGIDVKYNSVMDGIKYEYVLSGAFDVNGDWFSSIKIGFWSIADKVGASLTAGVFKNDIDYHYKLSVNAKTVF